VDSDCALLQENFAKDWNSYWLYVKVDMSKIPNYERPAFPLSSPIEEIIPLPIMIVQLVSRTAKVPFTWLVQFSVAEKLSKNLLLRTSGRLNTERTLMPPKGGVNRRDDQIKLFPRKLELH
jgi:hypothetical protein